MSWEWSHTQEAYDNAFTNLFELSRDEIEIIYCEIICSTRNEYYTWNLDLKSYDTSIVEVQNNSLFTDSVLIEKIWDFMNHLRTCDNGGFNAWCCPYGCHTVSFDKTGE